MVWAISSGDLNKTNGGFFYDLKQRIKHAFGWKLLITITLRQYPSAPIPINRAEEYSIREEWVKLPAEEIARMKYVRCEGWKDNLAWWGVPVYCRIWNGIVPEAVDDQTATYLNDRMQSDATKQFIKSLFKGSLPAMDLQKIILILILAGGAVFGMWALGVFK